MKRAISLALYVVLVIATLPGCLAQQDSQTATKTPVAKDAAQPAANPFKDNGDGTITDVKAAIMWQKEDDGTERKWVDAGPYCTGLRLANHSDWKLPGMEQLVPLWENAGSKQDIRDQFFPTMKKSFYWSSSKGFSLGAGPGAATWWGINFYGEGVQGVGAGGNSGLVRCFRPAQSPAAKPVTPAKSTPTKGTKK